MRRGSPRFAPDERALGLTSAFVGCRLDAKSVGDGVCELRIDYGPGYRVFYIQRGPVLIVLLAGGDKGTQDRDIKKARALAKELD